MKKIHKKDIGEIIEKMYESKITFELKWKWDEGMDYIINSKQSRTYNSNTEKVFARICNDMLDLQPDSTFSIWIKEYLK